MSLYMTASGRRVAPEFPDDLSAWPNLAKAVANGQRFEREFQEAADAQLAADSLSNRRSPMIVRDWLMRG